MERYKDLPICSPALDKGYGLVSDLNMTPKEIRSLELQGLIKNAISGDNLTWALTKHGREVRAFFMSKPSRWTRVCDWMVRNVLRMNIVI